ncbi:putative quinol monooxygenase [Chryseobacterium tongliaoense]|uniref:putative quinol monooxygenase n=1 Tax=Chryseobacterium tongliaoense TaxID=3240933 RepID=UPI0035133C8B
MIHKRGNIILIAEYQIKANKLSEVLNFLKQVAEFTVQEPGCLQYTAYQSAEDPERIILYEIYKDDDALEQHRQSDYFKQIVLLQIIPLLGSRKVSLFTPIL